MLMTLDSVCGQVYSPIPPGVDACNSCAQEKSICVCVPTWTRYASAELLWLDRTHADAQGFVVDQPDLLVLSFVEAGNVNDLMFGVETGVRGTIGVEHAGGHGLEVRYFGIYDQGANLISSGANLFTVMFNDSSTNTGVTSMTTEVNSGLHSGEINWSGRPWGRFRPIGGARWLRFSEDWDVYETALTSTGTSSGIDNNLYGGQIGLDVCLWDRSHWFRADARFLGGIFGNRVSLDANRHTAAMVVNSFSTRGNDLACAGQIDVTARWQPIPCFAFSVGYTGLWLKNVALLTDQSDEFTLSTGAGTCDMTGISYQGGHLAIEVRW